MGSDAEAQAEEKDEIAQAKVHEKSPLLAPSTLMQSVGSILGGMPFQMFAVFIFVTLGAGQALAARASLVDSKMPYDVTAAVFLAEFGKLVVSIIWIAANDRATFRWPLPSSWGWDSLDLMSVGLLYSFTNEFNFLVVERLGAALFMILGNLKIVFTCIFMKLIIGKSFAMLQWVAVALLTMSAAVVKIPAVVHSAHHGSMSTGVMVGLIFLFISTASSGLAAVRNEFILKKKQEDGDQAPPMSFMTKNAVLYFWGTLMNGAAWWVTGSHNHLLGGFNRAGLVSVLCLMGLGLACGVILRYLDNVSRLFGSVAQVLLTVAASRLMPPAMREGSFDGFYILSLMLLAAALVTYSSHASPQLYIQLVVACIAALLVGIFCMMLDKNFLVSGTAA
mmetsp:Transcript_8952/g.16113  ORF Transcript_8952/g.16113 Transcript_8952/m.16113 type:complete len:392 (-) Transcript_8952:173-1348(-)